MLPTNLTNFGTQYTNKECMHRAVGAGAAAAGPKLRAQKINKK